MPSDTPSGKSATGHLENYKERHEKMADEAADHRWWIIIAIWGLSIPVIILAAIPLGILSSIFGDVVMAPILLYMFLMAVSWFLLLPAFYKDRQYVAANSTWAPSNWYALSLLGLLGMAIAAFYIYKRREYVGLEY